MKISKRSVRKLFKEGWIILPPDSKTAGGSRIVPSGCLGLEWWNRGGRYPTTWKILAATPAAIEEARRINELVSKLTEKELWEARLRDWEGIL